jgi:predicted dienelactone hydrolase
LCAAVELGSRDATRRRLLKAGTLAATLGVVGLDEARPRAIVGVESVVSGIIPGGGDVPPVEFRLRLPAFEPPWPLVIYSHGLGGNLESGVLWCGAWQRAGFACLHLLHAPTSDAVFDLTSAKRTFDLVSHSLASNQVPSRCREVSRSLDYVLGPGFKYSAQLDRRRIVAAGHSYGALTVMALAGRNLQPSLRDARIGAAIALSPGLINRNNARSMASVRIPMMCITGSLDEQVEIGLVQQRIRAGVPLANRLAVFDGLPNGSKRLLFVRGADHMSFAGEIKVGLGFSRAPTWELVQEPTTIELIRVQTISFLTQWVKGEFPVRPPAGKVELQAGYLIDA